ncbi:hypothetical protein Q7C36_003256 [Tachysurus vachellii]|uniref:Uncharacterized protein n=1 Tax=Tachysurus vachellii TaxID=175792 RepID=A0AA88T4V0_TACVA|nr:hypothetical protein Q7C36_003256 [Tachysurus vachellii]
MSVLQHVSPLEPASPPEPVFAPEPVPPPETMSQPEPVQTDNANTKGVELFIRGLDSIDEQCLYKDFLQFQNIIRAKQKKSDLVPSCHQLGSAHSIFTPKASPGLAIRPCVSGKTPSKAEPPTHCLVLCI